MEKLEIRQGTNQAWFIYKNNKVLLGSHDKIVIEKVCGIMQRLSIIEKCKHQYINYTAENGDKIKVCKKCYDADSVTDG